MRATADSVLALGASILGGAGWPHSTDLIEISFTHIMMPLPPTTYYSILLRFTDDNFDEHQQSTIGKGSYITGSGVCICPYRKVKKTIF